MNHSTYQIISPFSPALILFTEEAEAEDGENGAGISEARISETGISETGISA
jgi:acetyl-CoA carboxylase alpha subunit